MRETSISAPGEIEKRLSFVFDKRFFGIYGEKGVLQMTVFSVNVIVLVVIIKGDLLVVFELLLNSFLEAWPNEVGVMIADVEVKEMVWIFEVIFQAIKNFRMFFDGFFKFP